MRSRWYKEAIVYQIYPFSFKDANNDGWGDIEGIISKLDYVKDLGVTAIWFSPLYLSPDYDYGYDISDYRAIDPKFGTMEDFDRLVEECHRRDLKVVMDMVINHTSTEHPWFKEAVKSSDSPYRDYYIIRKGKREKDKLFPPTNWLSTFTGSAWERIGETEDFYLHLFCKEQADLNWENPKVRDEIVSILNFWMEKGVDGFRFDVFNLFSKVYPIRDDHSPNGVHKGSKYFIDGPRMHEFLQQIYREALSHYDSYTVGESFLPSEKEAHAYVKESNHELDTIFHFEHLESDNIGGLKFFKKPFDLLQFKKGLFGPQRSYYTSGWNTLVLENHDNPRCVNRFGIDTKHYRYEAATMLATVTFMGFGIPFIYMGQEIGMTNCDFRSIGQMKDPVSHFVYDLLCKYKVPGKIALSLIKYGARDHARVPMQWDDSENAGFNTGHEPWQCLNPAYRKINVAEDLASGKSIYHFYQKLLALKKEDKAAIYGETMEYDHLNPGIIAYSRQYEGRRLFVVGNFTKRTIPYSLPVWLHDGKVLLNNYQDLDRKEQKVKLWPYQALVIEENSGKE